MDKIRGDAENVSYALASKNANYEQFHQCLIDTPSFKIQMPLEITPKDLRIVMTENEKLTVATVELRKWRRGDYAVYAGDKEGLRRGTLLKIRGVNVVEGVLWVSE